MSNDPRFKAGDKVRVRAGVHDPDNPDLPIGNWCGLVEEVEGQETPPAYLIRWDRRTRDNMPPVFVSRCNRDGLEIESMWLDEQDLEPDDGANLPIEQPKEIRTQPLREDDQDDRIRAVFGLTSNDELPEADEVTLRLYHAHLTTHLVFPFEARWIQDEGPQQLRNSAVQVLRLLPPDQIDPEDGLLCDVKSQDKVGVLPLSDIERDEDTPQGQLVEDYSYWFGNWGSEEGGDVLPFPIAQGMEGIENMEGLGGMGGMPFTPPRIPIAKLLNGTALFGAVLGSTVGAIHATIEATRIGMLVGSCILAGLLGMIGRRYGTIVGALNQSPRASAIGMLLGVVLGGLFGAVLGALAVAFVGTITGSIVGSLLGDFLVPVGKKRRGKFLAVLLGACVGGIILTFTIDRDLAVQGMIVGALVGAVGSVLLVLVAILTLAALMRPRV